MPSAIQQPDIPDAIRSLGGMERPDSIDLFTVSTDGVANASPEQGSRTAIEDVAGPRGQFIWRRVLGFRLNRSLRRSGWVDGRSPIAAGIGSGSRRPRGS
jgi:hypothetical protein